MKKLSLVKLTAIALTMAFLSLSYTANSQTISKYRFEPSTKVKATLPVPTSGHVLYAAPMVGLTPVELVKVNGTWTTAGTLNPLFAYGIGIGEYTTDAQGNYNVQPYVGVNAFISGGVTSNLQGSFQVGGLATFWRFFGIGGGYDVATKNPFLCTTFKFDISTFQTGAAFTRIKAFK